MRLYRLVLVALIILLAASWPSSPATVEAAPLAQFQQVTCPDFRTLDLAGGETRTFDTGILGTARMGQASNGVVRVISVDQPELPQWPQYINVQTVTLRNTTSLVRSVYYCFPPAPTPTRTPTGTPTGTPTNTPTNTPTPTGTQPTATRTLTPTPAPINPNCYITTNNISVPDWYVNFTGVNSVYPNVSIYNPTSQHGIQITNGGDFNGWTVRLVNGGSTIFHARIGIGSSLFGAYGSGTHNITLPNTDIVRFSFSQNNINSLNNFSLELCEPANSPTRTPTNTRTVTPTGTALPTGTPTTTLTPTIGSLGCVGTEYTVPVADQAIEVFLTQGAQIVVADAPIFVNLPTVAQRILPGTQTWGGATGNYVVYSVTVPARLVVCLTTPPTLQPTFEPTWTPGPEPAACIQPATPPPAQTGQIPSLSLVLPSLVPLPSGTPTATAPTTATIVATLVISPAHTALSLIIAPVQTAAAWCAATFGLNGYARAQVDAAPVVEGVAVSFGWFAALQSIGPLAWLIPPLLITVLVRVARPIVSAVKYVKQLLPFQ